jgi:hypothetical protein
MNKEQRVFDLFIFNFWPIHVLCPMQAIESEMQCGNTGMGRIRLRYRVREWEWEWERSRKYEA